MPSALLRPYASVVVLRCVEVDPSGAYGELVEFLSSARAVGHRRTAVQLVAAGLDDVAGQDVDDLLLDDVDATVHRVEQRPGWLREPEFVDVGYELTLTVRRADLVAVHSVGYLRDALQRWLDRPPRPPLRRIPATVLEAALLRGEAKSLWLRGTHSPRRTKADAKIIVGADLRAALTPFDDATFAMGSARSSLADSPSRVALKGSVGTTPQTSLVWNRQTASIGEFLRCVGELMAVLDGTPEERASDAQIFPLLARRVFDLAGVAGAYEISCVDPAELSAGQSDSEEKLDAALLLREATLEVTGDPRSADFDVDVTLAGSAAVRLRGRPTLESARVQPRFSHRGEPADRTAEQVRLALEHGDLLTIYYASGHAINGSSIFRPRIDPHPFPNWDFRDFAGYDIKREKPLAGAQSGERIHAEIGSDRDRSLFAWVVRHFNTGWLTCDDGSGEVADFVHLDRDGTLSLIHVKGAGSAARQRRISATAYEVVVSQAVKNITFLEPERLSERLRIAPVATPACWRDGERVPGRAGLIAALADRDARDRGQVIILQPHVSKHVYDELYEGLRRRPGGPPSADLLRLHRVESMLNAGRPSVTGVGADLVAIASLR
ncbi:MAG TPA: hypothetical protein VH008_03445 [Pseudonocardia sp.]|nr:hypothetical protein [Pseudonocardia sp.]